MSRRRSADPTKAIQITLPRSVLNRLDNHLSYTESRSKFIAQAVKAKLDQKKAFSMDDITDEQLIRWLLGREIPEPLYTSLHTYYHLRYSPKNGNDLD